MTYGILNQTIGIIGGGQLGKMMLLEAKKMGFYAVILDPTFHCPAHSLADEHIVASFDDEVAIRKLADRVDVITYEFEHIGVEVLKELEEEGHIIYPTPKSLAIIQNKYKQKELLKKKRIPVPDFIYVSSVEDMKEAGKLFGYPFILKSCRGGYDGKGNMVVNSPEELLFAFESLGGETEELMAEEFVPFTKEISVLACRGIDGETAVYPVGENIHQNNILIKTMVPAQISKTLTSRAMNLANRVMKVFEGVGMFCVEMFVTEDKKLLVNEVAPRPHNSGHYSIEGCVTSQFEQHIRAITGIPLGDTSLIQPTVMRNILGEELGAGEPEICGVKEALSIPGVFLHIYGKEKTSPRRKMGHITAVAKTLEEAIQKVDTAAEFIKIYPVNYK
ncbi:MAG TPA: 5-(carboxyamino)imidazole ribonucleotide synthase [Defluviitaleaceae bacterium]|jgi:5-(carboxyamino)imidazole ribonucleotide synthase|nr:5-(carboxyamino)imidazole ribonucleotide synthase [Candidatus Epulonipiscium sp.]HOQ15733.1 5-(carboxyamino)imidazole ribonucleotide synthase [Defluviitaleaceae bacterium]HPT75328.1 5-(carboxyamino)imidazole ribonucleotide synthase [Defluviitaleaceae bacterium]HQD49667.1 5-(carboxyamino)imidazole ribonucleotide synthase [Defluviitaleaceae bacterium]